MPRRTQVHQALADRDAPHPAAERPLAAVRADIAQDLNEGLLEQLIGDGGPGHQPADQGIDRPAAGEIDGLMGPHIARSGGPHHFGADLYPLEVRHRACLDAAGRKKVAKDSSRTW